MWGPGGGGGGGAPPPQKVRTVLFIRKYIDNIDNSGRSLTSVGNSPALGVHAFDI